METVFDYGITTEEWGWMYGDYRDSDKESYLTFVDPEIAKADIAALFYHRGDEK